MSEGNTGGGRFGMTAPVVVAVMSLVIAIISVAAIEGSSAYASNSIVDAGSLPPPPGPGSPMSQWQSWAAEQRSAMEQTNWEQVLASPKCSIRGLQLAPVLSVGADSVPSGVVTDAVSVTGSCENSSTGRSAASGSPTKPYALSYPGGLSVKSSTALSNRLSGDRSGDAVPPQLKEASVPPLVSTYCPAMTYYTYGNVYAGVGCVGTFSFGGNSYVAASYTLTVSGSTYGHTELGTTSGSCGAGSAVANESPEVLLTQNTYGEVIWGPLTVSASWSSTWWQDNGGGSFSSFGSVCGYY